MVVDLGGGLTIARTFRPRARSEPATHFSRVAPGKEPVPLKIAAEFEDEPVTPHQANTRMFRGPKQQMSDLVRRGAAEECPHVRARLQRKLLYSISKDCRQGPGALVCIDEGVTERASRVASSRGCDAH